MGALQPWLRALVLSETLSQEPLCTTIFLGMSPSGPQWRRLMSGHMSAFEGKADSLCSF
jgi:hypothetical protein